MNRTGENAIAGAVVGILSSVRQNVTFTVEAPLVTSFDPGRVPGTGEISVSFTVGTTQEIVAPGPFGTVLGGQVAVTRNQITLRATRPNQWLMHALAVPFLECRVGCAAALPYAIPTRCAELSESAGYAMS